MELILLINHNMTSDKAAFSMVKNCKTIKYPEGNCKMAWDIMVTKYASNMSLFLLKLKKEFENSKHKNVNKDQGLRTEIELIDKELMISEEEFMVKVLNNLPAEYNVVLDGLESQLDKDSKIDHIHENMNNYLVFIQKRVQKMKKKRWQLT